MKGGEANEVSLPSPLRSGEGGISPPRPPLLFSVILEKGRNPLLQTFTPRSQKISRISSKKLGNVFPSIAPTIKIRIPLGILQEEFRKGFGENLFPKVSPEAEPLLLKPITGVGRGTPYQPFSSP